jgi:hypothetical protein
MPFLRTVALTALLCLVAAGPTLAESTVVMTDDGRKILLRSNGTWELFEEAAAKAAGKAVLTLERRENLPNGCRIGLRMQNDLAAQIRTLVLRFTAYKNETIAFETVSRGYSYIKPTMSQYQEVSFRGITCDEISSVEVFAARNCHIGDLTKYSATAEDCLQLLSVNPSEIMVISRRQLN